MHDRIRRLLERAPVVDGHNDLPWELRQRAGYDFDEIDIAIPAFSHPRISCSPGSNRLDLAALADQV